MSMGLPGTAVSAEAIIAVDPNAAKPPQAAQPAPSVSNDQAPNENQKPHWLDGRLERERAKVLKDLGVDSFESAKAKLDSLKAKEDAEKSSAQKAAEFETSLKQTKAENEKMAAALSSYAQGAMGALTDAQRSAVIAVAGQDAGAQLRTIEALKPTWTAAAPVATAPVIPPPATPPAPVADTAPRAGAPKEGVSAGAAPDPWETFRELNKTNPIVAARFAEANGLF